MLPSASFGSFPVSFLRPTGSFLRHPEMQDLFSLRGRHVVGGGDRAKASTTFVQCLERWPESFVLGYLCDSNFNFFGNYPVCSA